MAITLSNNAVYSALTNMCLNLRVNPHDLGDYAKYYNMLVKDVEPYGRFYRILDTDAVGTYAFPDPRDVNVTYTNENLGKNILTTTFPAVNEDTIELDQFRQIEVSYEHFRGKQAFGTPTMFSDFVSSVTSWISDTFKLYMGSVANVFIGSLTSTATKASQDLTLAPITSEPVQAEAQVRVMAGKIAEKVQRILDEMADARRDYNALGYVRSTANPIIIWNDKIARLLKKGLQGNSLYTGANFNFENTLPERFFKVDDGATAGDGSTIRTLIEKDYTKASNPTVHCFPGDLVPNGYTSVKAETYTAQKEDEDLFYADSDEVACVIMDPEFAIIAHGETSDTSFENQKAHINTAWKTWSYGTGTDNGRAFAKLTLKEGAGIGGISVAIGADGLGGSSSTPLHTLAEV